jgi:hypothetical protein
MVANDGIDHRLSRPASVRSPMYAAHVKFGAELIGAARRSL